MSSSEHFFSSLPALPPFEGLCDLARHQDVPGDWWVAVIDVANSTQMIPQGQYKDVNVVSAGAITAVLNAAGAARADIAYVFGGDGATFLVPPHLVKATAAALYTTQDMALREFGIDMRAGMVEAEELERQNAPVRVAKIEMASGLFQAALSGEGVTLAEELVKEGRAALVGQFNEAELESMEVSFRGLVCRWQPLQSRNGVNVSLLIRGRRGGNAEDAALYQDVLRNINDICGGRDGWRPISEAQLNLDVDAAWFGSEVKVRTALHRWARLPYQAWIIAETIAGRISLLLGIPILWFHGRPYVKKLIANSDYIKFDNALRLVMDVTKDQKAALEDYLGGLQRQGEIFYGLHASSSALMTCIISDYKTAHLHFIDGGDGGYSLAAAQLKRQMGGG